MVVDSSEVSAPRALIIPTGNPSLLTTAPIGSMTMSGASLYVATSLGTFEKLTA